MKIPNTLFHLPLAFPPLAASAAIVGTTLITAGSTFKIFEIFETCVKERSWAPEKERKILNIGKALRNGALATAVSIAMLCLYAPPLSLSLCVTSACFTSMVVIVAVAARVFMQKQPHVLPSPSLSGGEHSAASLIQIQKRTLSSPSTKQGTGIVPGSPLEQKDLFKRIIEIERLLSEFGPIKTFRKLHELCLVNKSFHTICRAIQAKMIEDYFTIFNTLSTSFIPSFARLLQFAKQYSVTKLNFAYVEDLSECQYQQLAQEVPSLTHLKVMGPVSEEKFSFLAGLQKLEHLETSHFYFRKIGALKQLKYLKAKADSSSDPQSLKSLSHLKHLELDGDIPFVLLDEVVQLKGLESLTLDRNDSDIEEKPSLDAHLIKISQNLQQLQTLKISDWGISDAGFEEICKMKGLKHLSISLGNITAEGWKKLSNLKHLLSLSLFSINEGVLILGVIGRHLTELEFLDLYLPDLSDEALIPLKSLVNLRHFKLFSGSKITGTCLSTLADHLKELRSLTFCKSGHFTEKGFQNLLKFKKLEELCIDESYTNKEWAKWKWTEWVKEKHLHEIAENLPHLRLLEIPFILNESEWQAFHNKYPHLLVTTTWNAILLD